MTDFNAIRKHVIVGVDDPFQQGQGTVDLVERYDICGVPGMTRLKLRSPRNFWYIENLDKNKLTHLKSFLKNKQYADAVIWEQTEAGRWTLHIIEMKRTVDDSGSSRGWGHVKSQFAGAYRLCRMVAASLDVEFEQVLFYTAFVNDLVSSRTGCISDEDPISEVPELDMPDDMPLPQTEWKSGKCRLGSDGWSNNYTDREYIHKKIRLTESTDGSWISTGVVEL